MTKKNFLLRIHPIVLMLLSGFLLGLSWPTSGFPGLIFFGMVPLLIFEQQLHEKQPKKSGLKVFWGSYLSFFIWNLWTSWWIYNSTAFGMIFAVLANSSFYSILFWLYHKARKFISLKGALIFWVALWLSFEKFDLDWDFSWPWLQLGNVFSEKILWIQWYEYTGAFGGSLWVLLINCLAFWLIIHNSQLQTLGKKILLLAMLGLGIPIGLSLILFHQFDLHEADQEVLLVQPNEDPYLPSPRNDNLSYVRFLDQLIGDRISPNTRWILAPEGFIDVGYGTPNKNFENTPLHKVLQEYLSPYPKLVLLTGIQLFDIYRETEAPTPTAKEVRKNIWVDVYNSAAGVQAAQSPQVYHKSKLVVGVEKTPFKSILEPLLGDILLDFGGMVSDRATQESSEVFSHHPSQVKAAPIICYESIYGSYVASYVQKGAHFLAIITNDAWWGETPGHKQLLSYARLRAIETRRDVARSANTGISAFINARGEITQFLPYNQKGVLKGQIATYEAHTFYVRYGDFIARIAILIMILYGLALLSKRLRG